MIGPIGLPSFNVSLSTNQAVGLRPGQTLSGLVQGDAKGLWVSAGGTKIPLDAGSGLAAGQKVSVQVLPTPEGVQLKISASVAAQNAPVASDLPRLVADALRVLGAAKSFEGASFLVPAGVPQKPEALQALLSLFTSRESGSELQKLINLVSRAVQAGALSRDAASEFLYTSGLWLVKDAEDFPRVLRRAGESAGKSVEARLAAALRRGDLNEVADAVRQDLRGQLSRLLEDNDLVEFLGKSGELDGFREAAGRVMDRLVGRELQHLHGLNHPYLFLDLPFAPGSEIERAQVHIWGRRDESGRKMDPSNAGVALDVATTRLGDLWISVASAKGCCSCTLAAVEPEARAALEGGVPELVEALCTAGYSGVTVRVTSWDGNRLRETAALMRQLAGVDLKA